MQAHYRILQRVQSSLTGPLLRKWCGCTDPPVLTALAGWRDDILPVNECPRCGRDDVSGWAWKRTERRPSAPRAGPACRG